MKFFTILVLFLSLSLSYSAQLKSTRYIIANDKTQNYFASQQLMSQGDFELLLKEYNQKAVQNEMIHSQFELQLTKTDQNYFLGTFQWDLRFKTFQKNSYLPLIPKSWILTKSSSLTDYQLDSKHFKIALSSQMSGQVQFLVKTLGLFELPPVALMQISVKDGLGFTLKNPSNVDQNYDLSKNDLYPVGGLAHIEFSKTSIKKKITKRYKR
ncbi:hypothetical protein MJH12_06430 [bacterium]|nr:hypothetical protein [bacterium]